MGKIVDSKDLEDYEIWTDSGWQSITHIHKTIPYDVWELNTTSHQLKCADEHIVIRDTSEQVFVRDLVVGDKIKTETGIEEVISVYKTDMFPEAMYDVTVDSKDHTFYSDGILSHNTTMSSVFLVFYLLFNRDKTVAVMANKEDAAKEVLRRVKIGYSMLPLWLQQGIRKWNETSIELENGMRLICATTSADSISGETVSLLYLDEFAKVPPHIAEEFVTATMPVVSSGKDSKVIMISCVTDDTFVITPNGIREVSDFVDYTKEENGDIGYIVQDYKVMGHGGFKDGVIMCNSGESETRIITTLYSQVECSLRHPWWIYDSITNEYKWKKTSELVIDTDYVCVEYGHDVWSCGVLDDIDIMYELGYNISCLRYNDYPKEYFKLNREHQISFIRGLFGDAGNCVITLENIIVAKKIQSILHNFGVLCCIDYECNTLSILEKDHYDKLIKLLNDDMYKVQQDIILVPIKSLAVSKAKVYDFSLNETGDKWCHSVLFNNILGSNTPKGLNQFHKYWVNATRTDGKNNNFHPMKVNWWDHPDRDEEWKKKQLATFNGDVNKFNQEYLCRFLGSASTLIDPDILETCLPMEPVEIKYNGLFKIYEKPKPNSHYILGIDTSGGTGYDSSVVQVLEIIDYKNVKQVGVYRNNMIDPHEFSQVCIGISKYYNDCFMMIENNGIGNAVCNTIWYEYEYDRIINYDPKGLGIRSTTRTKMMGNLLLKRYMDERYLKIVDSDTIDELSRYVEKTPGVFKADVSHDDCVMALLWGLFYIDTQFYDGKDNDIKEINDEYNLSNSGPIMFLP